MIFTAVDFITLTSMSNPSTIITTTHWQQSRQIICPIREQVFIREQAVPPELEWDSDDARALHILAQNAQLDYVATARLLPDGYIGRMAVLKPWRKQGFGTAMLNKLLQLCLQRNVTPVLNAQTHAIEFYQKAGFEISGNEFMDAGIPHYKMIYQPPLGDSK